MAALPVGRARLSVQAGCALVLCLVLVVSGCGGGSPPRLSENADQKAHAAGLGERRLAQVPAVRRTAAAKCAGAVTRIGSSSVAYAALVRSETVVRETPRAAATVVSRVSRLGKRGQREVLGVIGVRFGRGCEPAWYRVRLSVLPNGTTGWVRAASVHTFRVHTRIVVDLSERRLLLYREGRLALETRVAVGASATPTPRGRFFVNERYMLPDASGPFGPNALGISAHSTVLQDSWVENGPIALHGTNEPGSIGQAASHGCVRIPNDVMRRLFPLAPAGTPVIVRL